MTQREALEILKTGRNVFITGPAGSGKTYVVNAYIKYLKEHNVPIGITASTGIAATHMGGITIHAWSGISVKDRLSEEDIAEIGSRSYIKNKVQDAKVLIIDEVSMLHHFRFDMIDRVLKHIKKSDLPFGGIQVVLCGDFFQLPPVARFGEPEAKFIYESKAWKEGDFTVCYLSENYRQSDDHCLKILNEIRSGEVSEWAREQLLKRCTARIPGFLVASDADAGYEESQIEADTELSEIDHTEVIDNIGESEVEPTRLFTHNVDVDQLNDAELNKVPGNEVVYEMSSKGRKPLVEALMKSCLAPSKLRLKKGARVMCVKNNYEKGYVNGTLGVVVSCGHGVDPVVRTAPTPDYPEGRLITLQPEIWVIDDNGKSLAEIWQYPLRLAWAITVHKSQGMSLDAVEVDLSKSFEPGMGYVALSRVRTLNGLKILGINHNALMVHPEVLEYDSRLKELSEKASRELDCFGAGQLTLIQNEFLARVAPLHSMQETNGKGKNKTSKQTKISTYEKTAALIRAKKTLKEIAKERGLGEETIIAQIEKLIEGGKGDGEHLAIEDIQYLKKEISFNHLNKIQKALEDLEEKMTDVELIPLSPIKSKIGNNISWKEIRLARVILGYIKKHAPL